MKQWIISYQYCLIVFCDGRVETASERDERIVPRKFKVMDDSSMDKCFNTLISTRRNVWVWCRRGLRPAMEYCLRHYIYIKAAGGIVHNSPNTNDYTPKLLTIYRNNHWDMAKGKVEAGETIRQAAVREVGEETGLKIEKEGDLILKTYHIYDLYGGWHLKQTSWYEMWDSGTRPIVPQREEGISTVEWMQVEEWRKKLQQSYSMMAQVACSFGYPKPGPAPVPVPEQPLPLSPKFKALLSLPIILGVLVVILMIILIVAMLLRG